MSDDVTQIMERSKFSVRDRWREILESYNKGHNPAIIRVGPTQCTSDREMVVG